MPNPLYNMLNKQANQGVINGVNQLKSMLKVNPEQYIQSMLNSGQITQQQVEQAKRMASMLNIKL